MIGDIIIWLLIICVSCMGLCDSLNTQPAGRVAGHMGGKQLSRNLGHKVVRVFIKPSVADPQFVKLCAAILLKTEFKSPHTMYQMEIIDNIKDATVTMEIGDRATMHADNTPEFDNQGERIYFSYTYDRAPRQIIFDPGNWCEGVKRSGLELDIYRDYVVRHEMMHALGYAHQPCNESTAVNGVCPVMYQSTRGPPPGYKCGSEIMPVDYTKRLPWSTKAGL